MKILHIGKKIEKIQLGGDVVNSANQKILSEFAGGDIDYFLIPGESLKDRFFLGSTREIKKKIKEILTENKYDMIFFSVSKYGGLCRYIKRNFPSIPIVTFFHNVELHFAKEFRRVCGYRAIPRYLCMLLWERKAVNYSDKIICLNQRDSDLLNSYYGRSADQIIPVALEQNVDISNQDEAVADIDYLFIGSAFFPNISGMQWFIDNVLPSLDGELYIVGKGMKESLFTSLSDKVHVVGFAESLTDYYRRARFIISPIFSGSGMKTKTAEALSYGKNIAGTDEAFVGYDIDTNCMILCNTADEFIKALNNNDRPAYNPYARELYEKQYSLNSVRHKYFTILENLGIPPAAYVSFLK